MQSSGDYQSIAFSSLNARDSLLDVVSSSMEPWCKDVAAVQSRLESQQQQRTQREQLEEDVQTRE